MMQSSLGQALFFICLAVFLPVGLSSLAVTPTSPPSPPVVSACVKFKPNSADLTADSLAALSSIETFTNENTRKIYTFVIDTKYTIDDRESLADKDYRDSIILAARREEKLAEVVVASGNITSKTLSRLSPVFRTDRFPAGPCDASVSMTLHQEARSEFCDGEDVCNIQCRADGCSSRKPADR